MAACLNKFPVSWASKYASWLARWEFLLAAHRLGRHLTLGLIVSAIGHPSWFRMLLKISHFGAWIYFFPTMRKRNFQRTIRSYCWQWCAVSILTSSMQAQSPQQNFMGTCHWLVPCQLLLWDTLLKTLMFHPCLHWIWPFWTTRMRTNWLKMLFWAYLVLIFPIIFLVFAWQLLQTTGKFGFFAWRPWWISWCSSKQSLGRHRPKEAARFGKGFNFKKTSPKSKEWILVLQCRKSLVEGLWQVLGALTLGDVVEHGWKKHKDGWQELCIQVLPPCRCCEQIFGTNCPQRRSQICSPENWYSGTSVPKV